MASAPGSANLGSWMGARIENAVESGVDPAGDGVWRGPALVALALLAAWVLVSWRTSPPAAVPASAPPEVFSSGRAMALLERVFGDQSPHPSGTAAHTRLLGAIEAELHALGLVTERHTTLVDRSWGRVARVRNLIATIPGSGGGDAAAEPAVLLVAHSDSVRAGPGASDDGAGMATLLETGRALLAGPRPQRDVVLLITDGEEDGLLGADGFLRDHPLAQRVGLVLNFEARGTGGQSMLFQTSGPNRWLMEVAAGALERTWTSSVADLVYNTMPNDTDLTEFIERDVPGINFAFIDGLARYHTPLDDLEHLDRGSLQHHGDNALALARAFGNRSLVRGKDGVPEGAPGGHAVFFDLLGFAVVAWPMAWSLPLGIAVLLLGVAAQRRAHRTSPRAPGHSASRALFRVLRGLALAVLLGSVGGLVAGLNGYEFPALARPGALGLATWAGLLLGLGLWPGRPGAGRAEFEVIWWGFALAGLATAWWQPAICYLFLVPAGTCALAVLLAPGAPIVAAALAAFAGALVWLPIVHGLRLGFGFAMPPLIALPLALTAAWLIPSLRWTSPGLSRGASGRPASARWARVALGAAMLVGTALATQRPRDEQNPAWVSLHYDAGEDIGSGTYRADLYQPRLPAFLASAAEFRDDSGTFEANAPGWDALRPAAELLVPGESSLHERNGHIVRLTSRRGASELFLTLPPGGRLLGVQYPETNDAAEPRWLDTTRSEARHWWFSGLGPEGLTVELVPDYPAYLLGAELAPAHFDLGDRSSELPEFMRSLLETRPADMAPRALGDYSILRAKIRL